MTTVNWLLPCGVQVKVDERILHFLPFFGCHDFCPNRWSCHEALEKCESFRKAYKEYEEEQKKHD